MPNNKIGRGKSRQNKAKSGQNVGKLHFVNSNTSSGSAIRVRVADDLTRRPLAAAIDHMHMPRDMQTQIHWFQTTYLNSTGLANNALTEYNQTFQLNSTAIYGGIAALFDQYAIFAAYVRVIVNSTAPVATQVPALVTAIDYDNTNAIGTLATLQGYSTSTVTGISEVQERYIEPCNSPALFSGSAFTHYGQARMWVDTANVSTPHYGIRTMVSALGSGVTGSLQLEITLVICARNVI
jgi:hypothetical protein